MSTATTFKVPRLMNRGPIQQSSSSTSSSMINAHQASSSSASTFSDPRSVIPRMPRPLEPQQQISRVSTMYVTPIEYNRRRRVFPLQHSYVEHQPLAFAMAASSPTNQTQVCIPPNNFITFQQVINGCQCFFVHKND